MNQVHHQYIEAVKYKEVHHQVWYRGGGGGEERGNTFQ